MKGAARGPEAVLEDWECLYFEEDAPLPDMIHRARRDRIRTPRAMFKAAGQAVEEALTSGLFPVILGGEHTVTLGPVRVLAGQGHVAGVIQLDAHADLRDRYEGSRYSHACVMRRIADDIGLPVLPVGVRALSRGEAHCLERSSIPWLPGSRLGEWKKHLPSLLRGFPDEVYLTVDMDFFDPSVVPGVGTPEPGGAGWYEALDIVDAVLEGRRLAGFDIVELCPPREKARSVRAAVRLALHLLSRAAVD
jgi:agmatinase